MAGRHCRSITDQSLSRSDSKTDDTDRVEPYDVHHQRLKSDDVLSMMSIITDARPRLIEGMEGLAGELDLSSASTSLANCHLGYSIHRTDGVAEPGKESSSGSSGSKLRFWDRPALSSVLAQQDISVAVSPNG